MNMHDIIIKPLITEKSMKTVNAGKFSFVVAKKAYKLAINKAVNRLFNVTVVSIATSIVKAKKKRVGKKRQEVARANWKKAIVTLKKGEKISLFEPGGEEKQK